MTLKQIVAMILGMFGCQREQYLGVGNGCYDLPGSPALCCMCWLYQAKGVPHSETAAVMRKNMKAYYEKNR